ncbi:hypothetical protein T459_09215 [Capsicum annuum]|uniref:SNF2 domain-containing protein CLASSY 3-like n=1 Tax=Capsicum annuum TaxID=4072 RepID=A0A2G2ZYR1_CAPAN|nr:hypothetical protein T459_09215 [Capsicum annuum]
MDSGEGSVPKRRTRQQFLKYCVDFIEKRNRLSKCGNPTQSSTCSVNVGKDVSCGSKRKMVEENTSGVGRKKRKSEDGTMVRNVDKRKEKVENERRKFSPGTCQSITRRPFIEEISEDDDADSSSSSSREESNSDVVIIEEEEAAVNTGEGSGSSSFNGGSRSVGLRSPMLNATDDIVSSASSMSSTVEKLEEFTDTFSSSSELECEASSDEDNDDSNDKNYGVMESSDSSQSNDIRNDFDDEESEDDDMSCPTEQKHNEKGKKESNGGLVPQLAVEGGKHNKGRAYLLHPRSLFMSKKKKLNHKNLNLGNYSSPILLPDDEESDDEESKSSFQGDCEVSDSVQNVVPKDPVRKGRNNRRKILEESEFLKFVVESIRNVDDHDKLTPTEEMEQVPVKESLPLIFRFEDEEPILLEKEEWEKEIEDLLVEMDMRILESHIGFTNPSGSSMTSGNISGCEMGNLQLVLDEQIGLICKDCPIHGEGTVWDLVPLIAKVTMYPHQRGGFEFMWKNIAGDITLERLREPLSDSKGGCIISHPPGTGKTRLTIVFLQSYLKLFPNCRPVIIAPSNLLLNWEAEFQKCEVDIPFHNLNSKDFSSQEDEATVKVFHCLSRAGRKNPHVVRMVKLRSWAKSKSVLGISYDLFRILTGEDGDSFAKEIREILLKLSGLLVLEEGHTARNEQSLVWKALNTVETEKRILLSGTPFQNNIKELYNTLCVSPKFAADLEQKWASLSSSIDKNARALVELRDMISPLVHKCSENVKKVNLPGIKDIIIHLKPTDLQKELLKRIPENLGSFYKKNLVSLISVHPSLAAKRKEFYELESQLKDRKCRMNPDIGVKMKFVVELVRLCGGPKDRVIIFSQLLDPLNLIKEQLNFLFGWTLGREILYIDGKLDVKQRQISINSLNDLKSDAKVLLASIKARSEGINLVGASRMVLLDVLWNPSVEQQAISRAYRSGQTKFVHVYCPVTSKWEALILVTNLQKRAVRSVGEFFGLPRSLVRRNFGAILLRGTLIMEFEGTTPQVLGNDVLRVLLARFDALSLNLKGDLGAMRGDLDSLKDGVIRIKARVDRLCPPSLHKTQATKSKVPKPERSKDHYTHK